MTDNNEEYIPSEALTQIKKIGEGEFGAVYQGITQLLKGLRICLS